MRTAESVEGSRETGLRWPDRLVEAGALFLLVFTPLAFGTVQPWSEAVAELVILGIAALWVLPMVARGELRVQLPPGWIPGALFLAFALIQLLPLPRPMVGMISPFVGSLGGAVSTSIGKSWSFFPLSLDPYQTWRDALKFLSVAIFFLVLYNTYRARGQATRAVWTMTITGAALALFGIAQRATWTGRLYWVGPEAPHPEVFGPFVNRAHFAGLMIIVISMALGLVLPGGGTPTRRLTLRGWRARLREWAGTEERPTALVVFFVVLMGAAALVSRSRGGFVSLLAALLCMIGLGGRGQAGIRLVSRVGMAAVLMLLAGIWIGGDIFYGTIEGLTEEVGRPGESFRARLWSDALSLLLGSPMVGTGLGSFGVVYPIVRTLKAPVAFTHAESDWVQLLTDTGLIGVGLALGTLVSLGLTLLRRRRDAERPQERAFALAGLVALLGTAVQGIANFNLPIMSNLLYLAFAVALALRAGDESRTTVAGERGRLASRASTPS
jgi:hypothetical protein